MDSTVFIVDDDPAALESVAALVQSHGLSCETFESAEQFLARYDRSKHGCLVADIRMTGMNGLELQVKLAEEEHDIPMILITGYADVGMAVRAMRAGAVTFLEKPCPKHELWRAIQEGLAIGESARLANERLEAVLSRYDLLTPSERDVIKLVCDGVHNKRIAAALDIGLRTVEMRRASIMKKLEVNSFAELIRAALMVEQAESK